MYRICVILDRSDQITKIVYKTPISEQISNNYVINIKDVIRLQVNHMSEC